MADIETKRAAGPPEEWRMRQQIRTRHLLLLQALDKHGTLSLAAADLSVTQPAATKLLAQLEALLQLPLFERHARGLKATEYGAIMIRHARAALGELSAAREALAFTAQGALGHIAMGAVVGSLPRLTSVALARLLVDEPRLSVMVTVETSATLVPMLERGELELVVGQIPARARVDELQFEPLMAEPLELIAGPFHRNYDSPRVSLDELLDDLWVVPPPASPLRERMDSVFHAAGLPVPGRRVETPSTLLATSLVQSAAQTIAVLPRDVARHYADHGDLRRLPIALPPDPGTIGLVTRRKVRLSAAAQRVVRALREVAAQAPAEETLTPEH